MSGARARTRVKLCGMTRAEDAAAAAALGADAIGMVFSARSPRRLSPDRGAAIAAALPPFVSRVALFFDPDPAEVHAVIEAVRPDLLQFHGAEPADFCRSFGRAYLKAVPMGDDLDFDAYLARYPDAVGFVLDAHASGGQGGTGRRFDWDRIPARRDRPLLLAGGLAPGNVRDAVRRVRPYGVDVASGIESAPGLKDYEKMRAFVAEVARADEP